MTNFDAAQGIPTADAVTKTAKRPPKSVFLAAIILVVCLVVPWWLLLERSGYGHLVFAVCVIFTLIAFGIAVICTIRALRDGPGGPFVGASGKWLSTWTGRLPMRDAILQILLIPGSLAIGFIALAFVDVIVRV